MPFSGDYKGYELDTGFIEEAHHTNPRRLYSTYGADWQYRGTMSA